MNKKQKKQLIETIGIFLLVIASLFYQEFNSNTEEKDIQFKENQEETTKPVISDDKNNLKVYFIDVGQADSILIDNNGEYALIDAGNNADGKKLVNYFSSLGITSFKYVIGTHAHEDHIGGMDDIIRNFSIEHFYMPDVITTTKTFEDVLDALEEKQIAFETPEEDATFSLANTKFKVLYVGTDSSDINDTSIILKATYHKNTMLFTGDASSKIEEKILKKDLESNVLKVSHHASQYSTSKKFLDLVKPQYAIIEVGVGNVYNHPKDIVLERLKKVGAKIYRTDLDGTIILESDGANIRVTTEKTDTNG